MESRQIVQRAESVEVAAVLPEVQAQAPAIERMMEAALKQGPEGVQSLRELVALHREVAREDANRQLIHAVAAFGMVCPPIPKTREVAGSSVTRNGTTYKRKFAPFEDMKVVVDPHLIQHGLSYTFDSDVMPNNWQKTTCTLWHVSGASRSASVTFPAPKIPAANDTQMNAGALTYGMRYSLQLVLGMATTDDNDGMDEEDEGTAEVVSKEQLANLQAVWDEVKGNLKEGGKLFFGHFKVEKLADMKAQDYAEALDMLQQKRR